MQLPEDLIPLPTAPWDSRPDELPLDRDEVRTAIWLSQGIVKKAAELMKVHPNRLRNFINNDDFLKREMDAAKEIIKDIAEGNVIEALLDSTDSGRRDTMSRWYLERQAKDRGFSTTGGPVVAGGLKGKITISWDTSDGDSPPIPDNVIDVTPNKQVANDR